MTTKVPLSMIDAPTTVVAFRARQSGTQSVAPASSAKLLVPTVLVNAGNFFSSANSRFTPPAGVYMLSAEVQVSSTNIAAGNAVQVMIIKNGSIPGSSDNIGGRVDAYGVCNLTAHVSRLVEANGTDYFEIYVQFSGGTGNRSVTAASLQGFSV